MLLSNRKQTNIIKGILLGTIVLIFGAIIMIFLAYRQAKVPPQRIPDKIGIDNQSDGGKMDKIHQESMREGIKEWTLDAESVNYSEKSKVAFFKSPKAVYYIRNSEPAILTADKGRLETEEKNGTATGNVVIRHDKFQLTTEELQFNNKEQRVVINNPLTITGEAFSLKADRMDLDITKKTARFNGNVEGEIYEKLEF